MRRREFIVLFGGVAISAAVTGRARAQHADKAYRIGLFGALPRGEPTTEAIVDGLAELGYRESENLAVEFRLFGGDARAIAAMAADLVRADIQAVVVDGPEAPLQAVLATGRSVPIVIVAVNYDPLARGYVASLARPGGMVTGVVLRQPELAAKQLELLKEAFPHASRLAILWDRLSADQLAAAESSARAAGIAARSLELKNPPYDFEAAFRELSAHTPDMVLVLSSPHFARQRANVPSEALKHRLPTMFIARSYVAAGGLMSYGADGLIMRRRAATYVDKILKGAKPGDLPIEQPSKFELVVNLKTAKALGVLIPQSVLVRADEVIE